MKQESTMNFLSMVTLSAALACSALAQGAQNVDWPLHNLDLAGSRFSPMDPDQKVKRRIADSAMAFPARRHRRG